MPFTKVSHAELDRWVSRLLFTAIWCALLAIVAFALAGSLKTLLLWAAAIVLSLLAAAAFLGSVVAVHKIKNRWGS